jgi:catechol 2,3-dioxygenase-like lactoylglutathione lyase family enzyme
MARIESVTLEVSSRAAAKDFYDAAFGLRPQILLRPSEASTSGFRGFTLSLIVA